MNNLSIWMAVLTTVAMLLIYEIAQFVLSRRHPAAITRTAHAHLREQWFEAISRQPNSEILAVQALRNSLMSATMMASTAVLGLMGTVTLAAPARPRRRSVSTCSSSRGSRSGRSRRRRSRRRSRDP